MCFGNVFSEYEEYVDVADGNYLLWGLNGSNDVDGNTKW